MTGVLFGLEEADAGEEMVVVDVDGERVGVPLSGISRATLEIDL